MTWRSGPREEIKPADTLAGDVHPLIVAHREQWDKDNREHFRELLKRNA
jgi:hypothetical protein